VCFLLGFKCLCLCSDDFQTCISNMDLLLLFQVLSSAFLAGCLLSDFTCSHHTQVKCPTHSLPHHSCQTLCPSIAFGKSYPSLYPTCNPARNPAGPTFKAVHGLTTFHFSTGATLVQATITSSLAYLFPCFWPLSVLPTQTRVTS
jgi:hypothetical protein